MRFNVGQTTLLAFPRIGLGMQRIDAADPDAYGDINAHPFTDVNSNSHTGPA